MNLVLERIPHVSPLSPKVLGTLGRKPKGKIELPKLSVELAEIRFDPAKLAAYREICGFEGEGVPIPYPQVNAVALHMHLMMQPQFPLPLVGLVHLRNRIEQLRELAVDEAFAVKVAITGQRTTDKGLEFDLATSYADQKGATIWNALTTILHRGKQVKKPKGPPPQTEAQLGQYHSIVAPEDIGRRYGRIAGDMNPIHLYPFTARLLGFERHIAHGMWTLASSCALLQGGLGRPPRELTTQFRQPLFLPARATLRYGAREDGFAFSLIGRDSGKLHLEGTLR